MQDDQTIPPDEPLPLDDAAQRRIALTVAVAELRDADELGGKYRVKPGDSLRLVYKWPNKRHPQPIARIDEGGVHAHPVAVDREPGALLHVADELDMEIRCPCTKVEGRHGTVKVEIHGGDTIARPCERCDGAAILNHTLDEEDSNE